MTSANAAASSQTPMTQAASFLPFWSRIVKTVVKKVVKIAASAAATTAGVAAKAGDC
jgi:hypothetical protein